MRYASPTNPEIRYPGVSEVAALVRGSIEGLLTWANKEGLAGRNHKETRQKASDVGTICHRNAYRYVHGLDLVWPDDVPQEIITKAKTAFDGFLQWHQRTALVVEAAEVELVSDTLRVGGRMDAVARHGARIVCDYKTGDSLYPSQLAQIAGYGLLWNAAHPEDPITGYMLLRFDRETGDTREQFFPAPFDDAREAFLLARRLWDLERQLQKRLQ